MFTGWPAFAGLGDGLRRRARAREAAHVDRRDVVLQALRDRHRARGAEHDERDRRQGDASYGVVALQAARMAGLLRMRH